MDRAGNQVGCLGGSIRDEDALYIMQSVVAGLDPDRDLMRRTILDAVKNVLSSDAAPSDTETLTAKMKDVKKKHARLLDIYMCGGIGKEEFLAARETCDAEVQEIEGLIGSIKKQDSTLRPRQMLLRNIEEALNEMLSGCGGDDVFYRHILACMVVFDRDHIHVYLNRLPFKWSYAIKKPSVPLCPDSLF